MVQIIQTKNCIVRALIISIYEITNDELQSETSKKEEQQPISVKEVFRHPLLRKWTIALGIAQ